MSDVYEQSLALHAAHQGKLAVASKVPLANKADLSLAYTPGVSAVCKAIAEDKQKSFSHTCRGNMVAVISDGSAILGLGNLGPEAALPVMEGKCVLFKQFAGVDAFPICLDTQDTEELIKTIKYLAPVFGGINLEDISAPRCFEIEKRLKAELAIPVMHDDQHGTATVVLAALINALKLRELEPAAAKVVINGAGAAGLAVADLLIKFGFEQLVIVDSKGALNRDRQDLNEEKIKLASRTNPENLSGDLATVIKGANIFVGVSAPGVLTGEMVATMAERPIICALANPVPEIMPEEAKAAGAFIVATGRSDFANQINNVLAFPGIFRGALDNRVSQITDEMLIQAARNLAALVAEPTTEQILPSPFMEGVSTAVAAAIV
jgi:malate dehydrogenase (oxaloacetate-decarboxylating)